jgi:hypothetical protein
VDKICKLTFKINNKTQIIVKRVSCVKPLIEPVGEILVLHKKGRVTSTTKTTYVEEEFQVPTRQQVVIVDKNGIEQILIQKPRVTRAVVLKEGLL